MPANNDTTSYQLLKLLQQNPEMSQRELARRTGVSLGKVNYCLRALVKKGFVKVRNFQNSENKMRYLYILTPSGVEERARLTVNFLKRKVREYDALKAEIEALKKEAAEAGMDVTPEAGLTP